MVPLLLVYDTTHEDGSEGGQPVFDFAGEATQRGPAFLGLGIERSNMQARPRSPSSQAPHWLSRHQAHPGLSEPLHVNPGVR